MLAGIAGVTGAAAAAGAGAAGTGSMVGAVGAPAEAARPEGWLRILPSHWPERGGLDGFFAVRLVRV